MTEYVFETAEKAVRWAVEVLRKRRLPRTARFWQEIESEAEWVGETWEGTKNLRIPTDADERMVLALKVMEGVAALDGKAARLLTLWSMGDWADEGRLNAALAIQEKCRREGVRVRLAYRYTYEQLGEVMGCDRKTAWRRVQDALKRLGEVLGRVGVVQVIEGVLEDSKYFKKDVYFTEFKNES